MQGKITSYSLYEYIAPQNDAFLVIFHKQYVNRPHSHDFFELVIVLSGTGKHCIREQRDSISGGSVFVLHPGDSHYYEKTCNLLLANVLISQTMLDFIIDSEAELPTFRRLFRNKGIEYLNLSSLQLDEAGKLLERITAEQSRKSPGSQLAARILFQELIVFLSRCGDSSSRETSDRSLQLGKMLHYISINYADDITREDIFRAGNSTIRTGNRIFAELLQSTPMKELLRIRMIHATGMLRSTPYPISEIAFRCGFRDSNYFTRCFTNAVGISPRNFRLYNAQPGPAVTAKV